MKSWAVPAACIVAAEYLVALVIGASVGFRHTIPFVAYLVSGLTVSTIGFFIIIALRLAKRDFEKALPWPFVVGVLLISLQMAVLGWTKVMLPWAVGFRADPFLASLDHAIFRLDPWIISHALFGWASPALDRAYVTWAPVKFLVLLVLVLLPESPKKTRAVLSYFVIVAAGALGQYLLPSAGPVFYERLGLGDRFSYLPTEPWVATAVGYLWHDFQIGSGNMGTGISAMPSMHVALALWMVFVLRSYAPKFAPIGWTYFGLTAIGSVHLGWHYVVDGIAAVAISALAWTYLGERRNGSPHPFPFAEGSPRLIFRRRISS